MNVVLKIMPQNKPFKIKEEKDDTEMNTEMHKSEHMIKCNLWKQHTELNINIPVLIILFIIWGGWGQQPKCIDLNI